MSDKNGEAGPSLLDGVDKAKESPNRINGANMRALLTAIDGLNQEDITDNGKTAKAVAAELTAILKFTVKESNLRTYNASRPAGAIIFHGDRPNRRGKPAKKKVEADLHPDAATKKDVEAALGAANGALREVAGLRDKVTLTAEALVNLSKKVAEILNRLGPVPDVKPPEGWDRLKPTPPGERVKPTAPTS